MLQEKLLELPFFVKYEDIEDVKFESLETAMLKLSKKFPIQIAYIMFNPNNDPPYYSMMVKETKTHKHLITVYAKSLREGYEKCVLYCYHYCIRNFTDG